MRRYATKPLKAAADPFAGWIIEGSQRDARNDPADR
jgi:hypothetical protein